MKPQRALDNSLPQNIEAERSVLGAPANTWDSLLAILRTKINPHSFQTWFAPTRQFGAENGTISVQVRSDIFRRRLTETYAAQVQQALEEFGKPELHIDFVPLSKEQEQEEYSPAVATPLKKPDSPKATLKQIEPALVMPEKAWYGESIEYRAIQTPRTEASANYHLGAFLAAVGACLGRSVYVEKGFRIHPNLFVVLVGKSGGARKSTAVNFGVDFARAILPSIEPIDSLDSREGFLEHMAAIGQKQNRSDGVSAIVQLGELRSLIEKTRMEGLGGIVPMLCSAYDAPPNLGVHTRKNPIQIERPVVSLLAATATRWMEGLADRDLEGGLGNRICWIPGEPGKPIEDPPSRDEKKWNSLTKRIRKSVDYWMRDKGTKFNFSFEAADRWREIYHSIHQRGMMDDPLISVLSERMQNHCLKAALVWAAIDQTDTIELCHIEAAQAFAEFCYQSLWKLFRGFGASPMAKLDDKIIEAVREAGPGGIRQRTLKRRFWRTDAEIFNKRIYYLSMNDGPLVRVQDGQKVTVFLAETDDAILEADRTSN